MTQPRERPDRPPPAQHRERAALCGAVARVANRDGLPAATPEAVAKEAHLPQTTFEAHFAGVHECFLAMHAETLDELGEQVDRAVATAPAAPSFTAWQIRVEAGFAAALGFLAGNPARAHACVVEARTAGPVALAREDATMSRFIGSLERLRQAHGEPVPAMATELIVRGTHELVHERVARGEAERLPELLPDLRYMWLVPFVGRHRASSARRGREA